MDKIDRQTLLRFFGILAAAGATGPLPVEAKSTSFNIAENAAPTPAPTPTAGPPRSDPMQMKGSGAAGSSSGRLTAGNSVQYTFTVIWLAAQTETNMTSVNAAAAAAIAKYPAGVFIDYQLVLNISWGRTGTEKPNLANILDGWHLIAIYH